MPLFFIHRPVFAWVVALFILLAGLLALPNLPVAQYPSVAPPQIELSATYPGASAQTVDESVVSLIQQELNSVNHLLYYSSSSSQGTALITVTFKPGTDPEMAKVDIQNRLKVVEPRLPSAVTQQGLQIQETSSGYLLFITLSSTDGKTDEIGLSDYMARNVVNELRRLDGVGKAQLFGAERAMRIWIDPQKLIAFNLSPSDVNAAITAQNVQVPAGSLGDLPMPSSREMTASVLVKGQLSLPEEFAAIVIKANADGSKVTVGDVARVEVGGQNYTYGTRLNGDPTTGVGIQLAPGANALETSNLIKAKMQELSNYFPSGVKYDIPYDTAPFVKLSIEKVIHTLIEAMVLVFIVMFLFLQNIRYTLIPALVVPVALMGTFATMWLLGFSINVLTLFGMVLAIGILVDDAIVVVENVERLMAQEGLPPKEATIKAASEISSAIVGITLVLTAVFLPMAFMPGSVGVIYQQFSVSMAVSILWSAFLALSLTPALCGTILKPIPKGAHHDKKGFFGWFNRRFEAFTDSYAAWVGAVITRVGRCMFVFVLLAVVMGFMFVRLPSSFLPIEDQGYTLTDIQLPPGASQNRTAQIASEIEQHDKSESSVQNTIVILGFSFSGTGQNAGLAFTTLKDWAERGAENTAQAIADRANAVFSGFQDAILFSILPPPIEGLGTSSGFEVRLQDRSSNGYQALMNARDQLMAEAQKSPLLQNVRETALAEAPQVNINVDRQQADAMGVSFDQISETLSTSLGSSYINDFPNQGRMQQVIVQSEAQNRQQIDDLMRLEVRNTQGKMVPLSAFTTATWSLGPTQLNRYNGYSAVNISGEPSPGYTTGEAMKEIERIGAQLPKGFGLEWTGLSLQEKVSGNQAPMLLALSMLIVFLCLAALYESWAIPISVLLVVPLGALGAVLAVTLRDMPNDVFFKVGLITIIGLSAKNAILIVEFAKSLHEQGMSIREACVQAARMRLRPIIMTSLAFILGVVPLAIASGASSASQQAIGTGVIGGMLTATFAIIFVPVFYVLVMDIVERRKNKIGAGHE